MKFRFNKSYLLITILFLIIEVLIALYLKGGFIRHTFGDFLVVILLYYFFKTFIKAKPLYIALGVLLIAYIIEFLQLIHILGFLQLEHNTLANTILGSTFEITDLISYTLGIITVLFFELYGIKKAPIKL